MREGGNWIPYAIRVVEVVKFMLAGKMRSLLIVDDEIGIRESLKIILKNDYEVFLAKNAEEAFSQIEEHSPVVILLDINLPDRDGLAVLERIKQNDPNIIVIVMTGSATAEVAPEARKLGAYGCVPKPFDIRELRLTIAQSLSGKALFTSTGDYQLPHCLAVEDKV